MHLHHASVCPSVKQGYQTQGAALARLERASLSLSVTGSVLKAGAWSRPVPSSSLSGPHSGGTSLYAPRVAFLTRIPHTWTGPGSYPGGHQ